MKAQIAWLVKEDTKASWVRPEVHTDEPDYVEEGTIVRKVLIIEVEDGEII
jgi:hypothetical protein